MDNCFAWAGFGLSTPRDWEPCRHATNCRNGAIVFADRRRQRLELSWRTCAGEPDLEQSRRDLQRRLSAEDGGNSIRTLKEIPGWTGFERSAPDGTDVAYAVRWERGSARVFQAAIAGSRTDAVPVSRLAEALLSGFADHGYAGLAVRWRAFGIDCRPPPGWEMVSARVLPMDVTWRFMRADGGRRDARGVEGVVRRLGMADAWFNGDARAYLQSREPELDFVFEETVCDETRATRATARDGTRLFHRLTGRSRVRRELIWQCAEANSLFRVSTVGTPGTEPDPADFRVGCRTGGGRA